MIRKASIVAALFIGAAFLLGAVLESGEVLIRWQSAPQPAQARFVVLDAPTPAGPWKTLAVLPPEARGILLRADYSQRYFTVLASNTVTGQITVAIRP